VQETAAATYSVGSRVWGALSLTVGRVNQVAYRLVCLSVCRSHTAVIKWLNLSRYRLGVNCALDVDTYVRYLATKTKLSVLSRT